MHPIPATLATIKIATGIAILACAYFDIPHPSGHAATASIAVTGIAMVALGLLTAYVETHHFQTWSFRFDLNRRVKRNAKRLKEINSLMVTRY